ncbi:MAG TPA: MFS transporter [Candidatus Binatia bacterium]|nr:MFS transporter [Candidatus Binatia bacterium]
MSTFTSRAAMSETRARRLRLASPSARYVTGRAISNVGDWLTTIAVAVSLWSLTQSVTAPAMAILLRVAPRPLGTLAGGHVSDRLGPLRTLMTLNLGRAAATGLLAAAIGARAIPLMLLLLVISQAAGAAAQPAGQAAVPRLVPPHSVARLNAALGAVDATALVAGPGVAAALLTLASPLGLVAPVGLVAADAVSFLVLAGLLLTLRPVSSGAETAAAMGEPTRPRAGEPAAQPGGREWAGLGLMLRRPFARQLSLAQLGIFATITALQAVLPAASAQRFGSADAIGWIYAAVGMGNAVGATALLRTRHRGLGPQALGVLTVLELIPLGAFALVSAFWADVLLAGVSGLASAPYEILAASELARTVRADRLGRVNGAVWLFGYTGMLAGGIAAVTLATRLGWASTLMLVWFCGAVALVAGWARPRRRLSVVPA